MSMYLSDIELSVIICTRDPRMDYLDAALESLKTQTLSVENWELVLVDNNSTHPLVDKVDLSSFPQHRIVSEETPGLTHARVKGIRESVGNVIVFVDDDNVLSEDYLQTALKLMKNIPVLGIAGAGKIIAKYEIPPPEHIKAFLPHLALRNVKRKVLSNEIGFSKAIPYGAGVIVLREIALEYVNNCSNSAIRNVISKHDSDLLKTSFDRASDIDLALHACSKEYVAGIFPELKLTHLISSKRANEAYLKKLISSNTYSAKILAKIWGYDSNFNENPVLRYLKYMKRRMSYRGFDREVFKIEYHATRKAEKDWKKLSGESFNI